MDVLWNQQTNYSSSGIVHPNYLHRLMRNLELRTRSRPHDRFGYCAYPAEYGVSGVRTFILNENNTIFWKDTQGEPVLEWPSDADLRE